MTNEMKAAVFLGMAILTFILPFLLFPQFLSSKKSSQVRPNFTVTYLGALCVLQGMLYLGVGIQSKLWTEGFDQVGWWAMIFILPTATGGLMLGNAYKWRLIHGDLGINFQPFIGASCFSNWTEIKSIKHTFGFVRILLENNRTIWIWDSYENVNQLLYAADEKHIPLVGFIKKLN